MKSSSEAYRDNTTHADLPHGGPASVGASFAKGASEIEEDGRGDDEHDRAKL
jgi:hypothetical protein